MYWFFFLTQANYSICLFFHGVVSLNLYFDAKVDFKPLFWRQDWFSSGKNIIFLYIRLSDEFLGGNSQIWGVKKGVTIRILVWGVITPQNIPPPPVDGFLGGKPIFLTGNTA